jgi:hypothetical protein
MQVQGVRAAALIDIETGMIVRSMGVQSADFPAAAASMAMALASLQVRQLAPAVLA